MEPYKVPAYSSAPLMGELEEFLVFPEVEDITRETMITTTTPKSISISCTGMEQGLSTGKNLCRGFNAPSSSLNTPEITETFEESFKDFFATVNNNNNSLEASADMIELPLEFNEFACGMENEATVWGVDTFEDDAVSMCVNPAQVENTPDEVEEETVLDVENLDVLKWIINDQQLDEPAFFNVPVELPVVEPAKFFIEPLEVEVEEKAVMVKTETLTDEEKYRRNRDRNNESSKICREKRKRKHVALEQEAEELEERNKMLKEQVKQMEEEVKRWKSQLLSDIAGKTH